jgi:dTDP-D-glucose 4,6-dehydratase
MAWLATTSDNTLPIYKEGKNIVPTIHIYDFVALIKRIIEKTPDMNYLVAVDKTKDKSLKNIISSISKSVGNSKVKNHYSSNANVPNHNYLALDVKMKPTKIFEDKQEEGEEEEQFLLRKFKWHCEVINN